MFFTSFCDWSITWGISNLDGSQCSFTTSGDKVLGLMSGEEGFIWSFKMQAPLGYRFKCCIYKAYIAALWNALLTKTRRWSEVRACFGYKSVECDWKYHLEWFRCVLPNTLLLLLMAASCHDTEFQFMKTFFWERVSMSNAFRVIELEHQITIKLELKKCCN